MTSITPSDIPFIGKIADDVCLSGGAAGADVAWGNAALSVGHQVVHWSFKGHKSHDNDNTYILNDEDLSKSDEYLVEANATLKRKLSFNKPYIVNLLKRSWYQVKYADSVYVVGSLNEKAIKYDPNQGFDRKYHLINDRKDRLGVNGGTAWAMQFYLDMYRRMNGDMDFNMILYDQLERELYSYSPKYGCWFTMEENMAFSNKKVGKPNGIYAAIGSRDLNQSGETYIEGIYKK